MVTDGRLVVVISPVSTFYDAGWKVHVAAFPQLGLMSYGDTPDIAVGRLKVNFREFIHAHRDQGVLEETLEGLGVRWHWADEYPDDGPEYENTNDPPEAVAVQPMVVQAVQGLPPERWDAANSDLAMVA